MVFVITTQLYCYNTEAAANHMEYSHKILLRKKTEQWGTWLIAQSTKCLHHIHEDQSLIPRTHIKKQSGLVVHIHNPRAGGNRYSLPCQHSLKSGQIAPGKQHLKLSFDLYTRVHAQVRFGSVPMGWWILLCFRVILYSSLCRTWVFCPWKSSKPRLASLKPQEVHEDFIYITSNSDT